MATLEDAIRLATAAHHGQRRFNGEPYILHPLRVMFRVGDGCRANADPPDLRQAAMMAAVLHDVVEDTPHTLDDLRQAGYAAAVVQAVDHLTRRTDESYPDFIRRIKPHPLARRIKLADLRDNMDLLGLATIEERDVDRLRQYRAAWETLTRED